MTTPTNLFNRQDNSLNDEAFHVIAARMDDEGFFSVATGGWLEKSELIKGGMFPKKAEEISKLADQLKKLEGQIMDMLEVDKWDEDIAYENF